MQWITLTLLLALSLSGVAQNYYQQQIYSVEVPISKAEAWEMWTTKDGITSFFAPKANIGGGVGEPFEVLIDTSAEKGKQGNEGCVITQYQPGEKLGFQWVAPPKFPEERAVKMEVFLLFEAPYENWTKVTLAHIGWQEGGKWPDVFAYFEKAWPWVMDQFEEKAYTQVLAPYSFVEGTWASTEGNSFEYWKVQSKQLGGYGYTVADGDTTITERFTLSVSPQALYFTPITQEEGDEEPFTASLLKEPNAFILEREGDDFPNTITYQLKNNALHISLAGKENDQPKEVQLLYNKVN